VHHKTKKVKKKRKSNYTIAARHGTGANKEYKHTFQKVSIPMNAITNSLSLFLTFGNDFVPLGSADIPEYTSCA